jgi:hypothetical protein
MASLTCGTVALLIQDLWDTHNVSLPWSFDTLEEGVIGVTTTDSVRFDPVALGTNTTEIVYTVLHEIAHVKAGIHNGHNHVWVGWCILLGTPPEICRPRPVVVTPQGRIRVIDEDTL